MSDCAVLTRTWDSTAVVSHGRRANKSSLDGQVNTPNVQYLTAGMERSQREDKRITMEMINFPAVLAETDMNYLIGLVWPVEMPAWVFLMLVKHISTSLFAFFPSVLGI